MGVPSPGETALVLAAVLASQGKLNIWLVIVIAVASAISATTSVICSGVSSAATYSRPWSVPRRRAKVIDDRRPLLPQHGAKTVFIGRWIALIRFATAWLAGINGMRFRTFFLWNALGGITWAITYGLVGYFGGNAVVTRLERVGIIAAIVLAVAVVAGFIYFKVRKRRTEKRLETELEADDSEPARGGRFSGTTPRRRPRLLRRIEAQCDRVDAVAQAGRLGSVLEHVAEMATAVDEIWCVIIPA